MPIRRLPRSPASLLPVAQWHVPKVLAVELEKVEGVQHSLADGAAPVQGVEDRDAIRAADYGLAVQGERRAAESSRRAGDRWIAIALAPVVTAPRERAHLVALAADPQPITIVFDLVDPSRPRRHSVRAGGDAGRDVSVPMAGIRWRHGSELPARQRCLKSAQYRGGRPCESCVSCPLICPTTT
jgi:hypothetical protein